MKRLLLLAILAVVCALFSGPIDQKWNGDGKMKKVILCTAAGVIGICLVVLLFSL